MSLVAPNSSDHYAFAVVGYGVDRVDFVCREVTGEIDEILQNAQAIGSRRFVVERLGTSTEWGVRRVRDGVSIWMESNLRHLPIGALLFAQSAVFEVLKRHSIDAADPVVSRLDLTTDVGFVDAVEADRVLIALSSVAVAGHKRVVYFAKGSSRVESVAWISGRRIRLRVYDSVAKDPSRAVAGYQSILRFEHQHAPLKAAQTTAERVQAMELAELAVSPLMSPGNKERAAGDLAWLNATLKRTGGSSGKADAVAERRLGTLVRGYLEGRDGWTSKRSADDRAAEMRRLGLSLALELPEPVDLSPLLEAVKSAWR